MASLNFFPLCYFSPPSKASSGGARCAQGHISVCVVTEFLKPIDPALLVPTHTTHALPNAQLDLRRSVTVVASPRATALLDSPLHLPRPFVRIMVLPPSIRRRWAFVTRPPWDDIDAARKHSARALHLRILRYLHSPSCAWHKASESSVSRFRRRPSTYSARRRYRLKLRVCHASPSSATKRRCVQRSHHVHTSSARPRPAFALRSLASLFMGSVANACQTAHHVQDLFRPSRHRIMVILKSSYRCAEPGLLGKREFLHLCAHEQFHRRGS
ncbi:hypothetical protein R3P38DRAFT_3166033 [Favolaschia claudopus]|uniref:Uncharacterized protein n=1 Tax=Favolaschia claudopus TaxID=2862362 RepID=A0AAW0ELV1_9AGAR